MRSYIDEHMKIWRDGQMDRQTGGRWTDEKRRRGEIGRRKNREFDSEVLQKDIWTHRKKAGGQMSRKERGRRSDGDMEIWRDGEMERWRDGEMERWRDGEMER